jgi:predicted ArsR family transcriptional regulator
MTAGKQSRQAQISAVTALDEPTRRGLYDYMVRQDLLAVDCQRRTGRTGPGAGRPAKLYPRSDQHVAVSLPQRRYDLAGQLLSSALEHAERSRDSPRASLNQHAYQLRKKLGKTARSTAGNHDTQDTPLRVLDGLAHTGLTAHLDPHPAQLLRPHLPG